MNCTQSLPRLEDYLYQKLAGNDDKQLAAHLEVCGRCAVEYAVLRREQEIYARCELQVAPEFWAGVEARITHESKSKSGRFAFFRNALRLNPVAIVATCVLILASLVGVWRYFETRPAHNLPADRQEVRAGTAITPEYRNDQVAGADREKKNIQIKAPLASTTVNRKSAGVSASRTNTQAIYMQPVPEQRAVILAQRKVAPDLDADTARHIEQAEMLLRSFKNGRMLRHASTLDLSYESGLSRDLLGHNILLRTDAESAGNVALARLLNRLEPFLLDIANLRDNSDRKEIRLVRDSLMKEQIIAALQSF
jgi:Putative zinc-finger